MLRIVIALLCLLMAHSYAFAGGALGVYLAPRAMFTVQHTEAEAAFMGRQWGPRKIYAGRAGAGLALGYDFQPRHDVPLRMELAYAAFDHVSKRGQARILRRPMAFTAKLGVQTMLANVYADLPTGTRLTPFLTAGVGGAQIESRGVSPFGKLEKNSRVFAGKIGGGCSFAFTPTLAMEAGYSFLMLDGISDSNQQMRMAFRNDRMHQIWLGLRVVF